MKSTGVSCFQSTIRWYSLFKGIRRGTVTRNSQTSLHKEIFLWQSRPRHWGSRQSAFGPFAIASRRSRVLQINLSANLGRSRREEGHGVSSAVAENCLVISFIPGIEKLILCSYFDEFNSGVPDYMHSSCVRTAKSSCWDCHDYPNNWQWISEGGSSHL